MVKAEILAYAKQCQDGTGDITPYNDSECLLSDYAGRFRLRIQEFSKRGNYRYNYRRRRYNTAEPKYQCENIEFTAFDAALEEARSLLFKQYGSAYLPSENDG